MVDGNIEYAIVTGTGMSTSRIYSKRNASDVSVTNTDNDVAGISVNPTSGLTTTEAGGTATFTVGLNNQPTANVSIGVSSNDLTQGAVGPAPLSITSANRNVAPTVTAKGMDEPIADGEID